MEISKKWLEKHQACQGGVDWFLSQSETNGFLVVKKLVAEKHWAWANWTICRLFNREQKLRYAIYAAGQVLCLFEQKYPDDKRPRAAINAARICLKNPTKKNSTAAAADAAYAAAAYADAAYAAAYADAAYAAADAAAAAADAADAAAADAADAADAAYAAAAYAADAADAAYAAAAMKTKTIRYGLRLLNKKT